jgi:DNA-binding response OmpR family regulator
MGNRHSIIVVEDDQDFRESMVEYLTLASFEVTGVSCALDLYSAISKNRYQIAVLDIGLPDQNGLVLAEYIRKNSDMRIVMLTAQAALDSKIMAYRSGADIYLVKPIDFAELSASLESLIGRIRAAEESLPLESARSQSEPVPQHATDSGWKLLRNECSLLAPQGSMVSLTSREFDLLEKLAFSAREVVERADLLQALAYDNDELGNKALDALVHRLRRKKEDINQPIPLKTSHGVGYSFAASIVIL